MQCDTYRGMSGILGLGICKATFGKCCWMLGEWACILAGSSLWAFKSKWRWGTLCLLGRIGSARLTAHVTSSHKAGTFCRLKHCSTFGQEISRTFIQIPLFLQLHMYRTNWRCRDWSPFTATEYLLILLHAWSSVCVYSQIQTKACTSCALTSACLLYSLKNALKFTSNRWCLKTI